MPLYLDPEPRDTTPLDAPACEWQVVRIARGRVSLTTCTSLHAPAMGGVFTLATLPQLKQIVALLEKDQPTS